MTIRIEITGESASQIAQELVTLAFMVAPKLKDSLATSTASGPSPDLTETVEPVDKPKAPRGRKPKGEVIEHDSKEMANVASDTAEVVGEVWVADASDEQAAGVDAVAETAGDPAPAAEAEKPCMTRDDLRKYLINQYLNVVFDDMEARKKDYKALLDEFGIEAIADIPEEKINPFKAAIDARIAAAVGGK